jgi:hypothetical protein
VYLGVLEHFLVTWLDINGVIRHQDGAPPHCHTVTRYLNQTFLEDGLVVESTFRGHPDHPISRPWTFHFGGFMKDNVYIPLMPVDLQKLRDRFGKTIVLVDVTFLKNCWYKLEYRLNICRITRGSHIKNL